jgi:hypothetical protein
MLSRPAAPQGLADLWELLEFQSRRECWSQFHLGMWPTSENIGPWGEIFLVPHVWSRIVWFDGWCETWAFIMAGDKAMVTRTGGDFWSLGTLLPGRIITRSDGRVVFSGSGPGQISLGIAVLPARQQKCGVEYLTGIVTTLDRDYACCPSPRAWCLISTYFKLPFGYIYFASDAAYPS